MKFVKPAETVNFPESAPAIFEKLHDYFRDDWRSHMAEIAECLVALRRNHSALRSLMTNVADRMVRPNLQGAQSFVIYDCALFVLRINLWFPFSPMAEDNDRYRKYLSIDELHNHDFEFLTICLSGPGYWSEFFRDLDHSFDNMPGDKLILEGPHRINLTDETVMFVEKDFDYHSQEWPESFSTTLNCIPKINDGKRVQYVVDRKSFEVLQTIRN